MTVRGADILQAPSVFVGEDELTLGDARLKSILDKCGVEFVLHKLWGFDNTKIMKESGTFFEIQKCRFRSRTGNIVEGNRYVGFERLDDEWIEQGNASDEAKVIARQDMSYIQELRGLGKRVKSL